MIRLSVAMPDGELHRTFRGNTVVVGRSRKADLSLPGAKGVSRFHCRLTLRDGECSLEDLGSRNKCFVNGNAVAEVVLREGDRIRIGTIDFRVEAIRDSEPTEELVHPCLNCGHLFPAGLETCPRCRAEVRRRTHSRAIGELSFPGYKLRRKIGAGGMGVVFEADDLAADRRVALKVLRPYLARNLSYLARFIEEIRVLTSLRHPGIVQIYGRGKAGDLHYLTMELVEGKSAREMLRESGVLPWRTAVRLAWEAAKALNAAHQLAGVVHGDVKPANFLVDAAGHVKLCDFGLAAVDLKRQPLGRQDREQNRRGTAAYAAPERFLRDDKPTVRGDLYSLGVSIFHMTTGKLPFHGFSVADLKRSHLEEPVPDPSTIDPSINPAVGILVRRLMAKREADRPAGYPEIIEDLSLLI